MDERSSPSHVANNTWDRQNVRTDNRSDNFNRSLDEIQSIPEPPPIVRPSRAFKHFQNPPQPHMCIRHHTVDGEELFINVMSWTRIVMPQNADEPIPLYGGMRVPPSSSRSPPLVYAVMANPEILKHVGRNCPDPEKRLAVVELMCEFVEAMNPGLKLAKDAEVLKDRDLSGELKDIWGAVQAKREREKEGPASYAAPSYENHMAAQNQVTYMEFGPETSLKSHPNQLSPISNHQKSPASPLSAITNNFEQLNGKSTNLQQPTDAIPVPANSSSSEKKLSDETDSQSPNKVTGLHLPSSPSSNNSIKQVSISVAVSKVPIVTAASTTTSQQLSQSPQHNTTTTVITTPTTTATTTPPTSTKKEKLGGFLPNGCHNIFPFIKSKSSQSKKEMKEKKAAAKAGVIDLANKSGSWKGTPSTTTTTNATSADSSTAAIKDCKDYVNSGKSEVTKTTSNKVDLVGSNRIPSSPQQQQSHDSNGGFKDDACVDKMQKLKL